MKKIFPYLFAILVISDILVGTANYPSLRVVTKPLILISLLVFFFMEGRRLSKNTYYGVLLALFLSLSGDVFLLFDAKSNSFFILGLVSFLLAHITYALVFLKDRNGKPPLFLYGILLLFFGYGILLFSYLEPDLGSLTYPVLVYVIGILAMAISALWRYKKVATSSFLWVFVGALFFVASDSFLAINMFKFRLPWSSVWVMGTYAAAQFLLVNGVLKQINSSANLSTLSYHSSNKPS
ncbi:MAG: lysoplasmalogenase [Flavobacteriaceae bacterium]